MDTDTAQMPSRPPTIRAAITNGTRLLLGDGRKVAARRHRDLVFAFAAECGLAFAQLAPSDQIVIRRLAELAVQLEAMESKSASGETIDGTLYLSLCNCQRRAMGDFLKLKQRLTATKAENSKTPARRGPTRQRAALDALRQFGA
jgi:hypothetical protein